VDSVRPDEQMTRHAPTARTSPCAYGQRELRASTHPGLGRQDQALSRSRPLRLRAARTARPARVRMRSRKPCVLARRRLFGWNVRLLTGAPGKIVTSFSIRKFALLTSASGSSSALPAPTTRTGSTARAR
jgi:hypothetical protein